MDADHAIRDRGRMKISELWRPLPWWERVVYLLTALLLLLGFLPEEVLTGRGDGTLNLRVPQIEFLLLTAVCFPFLVATCVLAMRRWRPEGWRDFRRLWSMRAVLIGTSVLFAFGAWASVIDLATPPDRIPPNLPSFLEAPAIVAAGLVLAGTLLAAPEIIVRTLRARRRQP